MFQHIFLILIDFILISTRRLNDLSFPSGELPQFDRGTHIQPITQHAPNCTWLLRANCTKYSKYYKLYTVLQSLVTCNL